MTHMDQLKCNRGIIISHLLCWALSVNVVARVDAVERGRTDGEAGGLLGLVVGGDARVGRLI